MKHYAQGIVRWGSALLLAYLALFFWVDSMVRVVARTPPPFTWLPLILVTLGLSARVLWYRERWAWWLVVGSASGLLVEWHPLALLLLPLLAATRLLAAYYRPSHKTVLARSIPIPLPVTLTPSDRFLHLHVLGPTGSGKSSSVLMPLMVQDIVQGAGLMVLEPKGDLSAAAYHRALKHERSVIRLDPMNPACPHFNPLAGPADEAAEGIAWCLNQMESAGHPYYAVATRIRLLHAVRVIKACLGDQADIGELLAFFRDPKRQQQMVRQAQDPAADEYFREQWARKSGAAREDHQGLLNRLELLWASPVVRRVLSQPADFDWDEVLADRWVVICSLSLAQLGQSARALGTLIWHGLAQAAYRRNPAVPNPPFFVYLDEFHQWVSEDLADFLALARGYSVGLILAHQELAQLSPALQEAVFANARHRIILPGTAARDIARFRQSADPYVIDPDLRYKRRGQAVLQVTTKGRLMPPRTVRLPHHGLSEGAVHGS